mgnify:CR=1 FL=1
MVRLCFGEDSGMSSPTLRQIFRYRFDNFMARGGSSIFLSLTLVFLGLLTLFAVIRLILVFTLGDVGDDVYGTAESNLQYGGGWLNNIYVVFLQMTDPGNMNHDMLSSAAYKVPAIFAGMSGVIMLSALIAFITTALDQKIAELKKGHSKVIAEDHTLILGWNERVVEVIRELVIANESEDDPCIVILASKDKEEMDDFLKVNMPDTQNTRIVTRSGTVSSLVNLEIVSVEESKSVIVLANCNQGASEREKLISDTMAIKTVLAVMAARSSDDVDLNVVAEVFDDRNRDVIEKIAPEHVSTIDTNEILAKILVQTSRSAGLSVVYNEILSFDGCEMYFHHDEWGQSTFGEMAFRWPDAIPMCLRHADGSLAINPPPDTPVQPGDDVLILAEDDSTIDYQSAPVAKPRELPLVDRRRTLEIERELIIGWTPKVPIIVAEYADYVKDGSEIDIMLREPDETVRGEIERIDAELEGVRIRLLDGDPLTTAGLLAAEPFKYDNIIILSQSDAEGEDERVDSETIVILLLLRRIFEDHQEEVGDIKLITEVLDSDNQVLVASTGVQDFVISNRMVSMVLAQMSEDADIKRVYDDLFQEDGSEIYLKPASLYLDNLPIEMTYADAIALTQKREEICLGVKIKADEHDMDKNFGVKLIPEKNTSYTIGPEDCFVVVAENET